MIVKKSTIIYHDALSVVNEMPDDLAGKFVKELLVVMEGGTSKTEDLIIKMALHPFSKQIKRDMESYIKQCENNKINGKKGGRPRKTHPNPNNPSGLLKTHPNPNNPDKDKDKDKDKEYSAKDSFAIFWDIYPKKKDKAKAKKWWLKNVSSEDKEKEIIIGITKQLEEFRQRDKKYIPLATTWLNGARWEDEVEKVQDGGYYMREDGSSNMVAL